MNYELLGLLLKKTRKQLSWSLKDLEEKTGFSNGFLSEIERGKKTNLKFQVVADISSALNIDFYELIENFATLGKDLQRHGMESLKSCACASCNTGH